MCSIARNILLAFLAESCAEDPEANHRGDSHDAIHKLVDNIVDNFFDRALGALFLSHSDLEGTMLGKGKHGHRVSITAALSPAHHERCAQLPQAASIRLLSSGSSSVPIVVKWNQNEYKVVADASEPAIVLKMQLYSLTSVPPEQQSITMEGGSPLRNDESLLGRLKEGQCLMMTGGEPQVKPEEAAPELKPCVIGCGFHGSAKTEWHCSKCWADKQKRVEEVKETSTAAPEVTSTVAPVAVSPVPAPAPADSERKPCVAGCGFFGTEQFDWHCSKCWADKNKTR